MIRKRVVTDAHLFSTLQGVLHSTTNSSRHNTTFPYEVKTFFRPRMTVELNMRVARRQNARVGNEVGFPTRRKSTVVDPAAKIIGPLLFQAFARKPRVFDHLQR